MPGSNREHRTGPPGAAPVRRASPLRARAEGRGLGRAFFSLVGALLLSVVFSCGSPASTNNPSSLWVAFGQTELDLILVESEPPYY